jgi:hypothetical protein
MTKLRDLARLLVALPLRARYSFYAYHVGCGRCISGRQEASVTVYSVFKPLGGFSDGLRSAC